MSSKRFGIIVFIVVLALTVFAWSNRFIQDDAFISFRYADNLVRGNGLVWNPGERVEGYTNFLWTLIMAVPLALGADPIVFSFVLGFLCFALTLVVTLKCASFVCGSRFLSVLAVIFLGLNYSFSAYATGGLETQFQTFLLISCIYLTLLSIRRNEWPVHRLLGLSFLHAAAILTRPDSVILATVCTITTLFYLFRRDPGRERRYGNTAAFLLPVLLVVGGWTVWRVSYYGEFLPTPYLVKACSAPSLHRGAHYIYSFLYSYWLLPVIAIGIITGGRLVKKLNPAVTILFVVVFLWIIYVIRVGGDFMEYRLLVPVLPLAFILVTWTIDNAIENRPLQAALVALVVAGSIHHSLTFENSAVRWGITPIRWLHKQVNDTDGGWAGIGRTLGIAFDGNRDITIATTASGAIPYYSRLITVDMLGLNDRWVACHGDVLSTRPGHQRLAPLRYLVDRHVSLVIGHPWVVTAEDMNPHRTCYAAGELERMAIRDLVGLPDGSKILEIPIDRNRTLIAVYLHDNPLINKLIREHDWHIYPVCKG
ncbi:MAG: hypothetical protein JSV33_04740 [bacterium]|nr:MAG: hypothetical protein JSV33_04740 [bacterium]